MVPREANAGNAVISFAWGEINDMAQIHHGHSANTNLSARLFFNHVPSTKLLGFDKTSAKYQSWVSFCAQGYQEILTVKPQKSHLLKAT